MSFPFFIWTMQRTGGTSLTDLLMKMSEHKTTDHEPFLTWGEQPRALHYVVDDWNKTKDKEQLENSFNEIFAQHYLIKHCYELLPAPFNQVLVKSAANTNYRHIFLLRRDEQSRLISMAIAEGNGTWFRDYARSVFAKVATGQQELEPLPVDRIVQKFRHARTVTAKIRNQMTDLGIGPFELYYEDLYVGDREPRLANLRRLFDFLGFSQETIEAHSADIEKLIFDGGQATARIVDRVPNLDAVIAALAAAGYKDNSSTEDSITSLSNIAAGNNAGTPPPISSSAPMPLQKNDAAELAKFEKEFPFPNDELERAKRRRPPLMRARQGGVGAEIGVFRGHFSPELIDALKPTKIYLIDPWTKMGEFFPFSSPYNNHGKLPTAVARREAQLRTARFTNTQVEYIEGFFLESLDKIKEKLDWVYLDASHRYKDTLLELNAIRSILKDDGAILGDDWYPDPAAVHHGVYRAVQEFTRNSDFQIVAAGNANQFCLKRAPKYPAS
ncbi:MAG: class I SAM-dependent methyltransferase [Alphaproteobacteria bacterium]|nr:class I SAM-dependent methyltransferase [Alphaproteobacteria bacterium]